MQFSKEFEDIYIKYSDKIYRYIYLSTFDPYLSEDITSETFLKIWKSWERIKRDFIQALLYKTAKNILIDHWRKHKNGKKVSLETTVELGLEPSYDEDLIEKMHKDANLQKINDALKLVPENLKEVLILRFVDLKILNSLVNIRRLNYQIFKSSN